MPMMNFRLAQPAHLIDINFIDGLDYIRSENGALKIGCLARQSRLLGDPLVRQRCPLLAAALTYVGYEQTRNRGTYAAAWRTPIRRRSCPRCCSRWTVRSRSRIRRASVKLLRAIFSILLDARRLPATRWCWKRRFPSNRQSPARSFIEFARRFGDFAIVGVAASLTLAKEQIADARIALTGVGDKPWREPGVEEMLIGQKAAPDLFNKAAGEIAANIDPSSDIHASAAYRRSLANVLTRRALNEAWQKARIGD